MVVLLMLIPLLAPNESGAPFGLATISKALGLAAIKVHRCFSLSPFHAMPPRTPHGIRNAFAGQEGIASTCRGTFIVSLGGLVSAKSLHIASRYVVLPAESRKGIEALRQ